MQRQTLAQEIFAHHWREMPVVLQQHYATRSFSKDKVVLSGAFNIECKKILQLFAKPCHALGLLPFYPAQQIPVTVILKSLPTAAHFEVDRIFYLNQQSPLHFRSKLCHQERDEIIGIMALGICWHCYARLRQGQVYLEHKNYSLKVGQWQLPLPIEWLIGKVSIEEKPLNDFRFSLKLELSHPWWGQVYGYQGQLSLVSIDLDH